MGCSEAHPVVGRRTPPPSPNSSRPHPATARRSGPQDRRLPPSRQEAAPRGEGRRRRGERLRRRSNGRKAHVEGRPPGGRRSGPGEAVRPSAPSGGRAAAKRGGKGSVGRAPQRIPTSWRLNAFGRLSIAANRLRKPPPNRLPRGERVDVNDSASRSPPPAARGTARSGVEDACSSRKSRDVRSTAGRSGRTREGRTHRVASCSQVAGRIVFAGGSPGTAPPLASATSGKSFRRHSGASFCNFRCRERRWIPRRRAASEMLPPQSASTRLMCSHSARASVSGS